MSRLRAHPPEIVRAVDDALAKVVVPDTVHDRAPRQRVAAVDNPFSQGGAARPFVIRIVDFEPRPQAFHSGDCAGAHQLARRFHTAAAQQIDREASASLADTPTGTGATTTSASWCSTPLSGVPASKCPKAAWRPAHRHSRNWKPIKTSTRRGTSIAAASRRCSPAFRLNPRGSSPARLCFGRHEVRARFNWARLGLARRPVDKNPGG